MMGDGRKAKDPKKTFIRLLKYLMLYKARIFTVLLCIFVATTASLVSARFANRVKNRTVGLVTGVVLTVLGVGLIILNYWVA